MKTIPSFVLGSTKSSTESRGYASGYFSPKASLDDRFDQPAGIHDSLRTLKSVTFIIKAVA
jgi:hypothetical protein